MADAYDVIVIPSGAGGGTHPALTAMANLMRVGDHLLERMGAPAIQQEPAGDG